MRLRMITLGILAGLLMGCSDSERTPTGNDTPFVLSARDVATISSVVQDVATSYGSRDLAGFQELFDSDRFRFVLDPVDVAENPDFPIFWNWDEENSSTGNLLDSDQVTAITCSVTPLVPPRRAEEDDDPLHPGSVYLLVEYDLAVETHHQGDPLVYGATGRASFFLLPTPAPEGNARDLSNVEWKIVEWRDIRIGSNATEEVSWGWIKAMFR